jgi:hypothetical protein
VSDVPCERANLRTCVGERMRGPDAIAVAVAVAAREPARTTAAASPARAGCRAAEAGARAGESPRPAAPGSETARITLLTAAPIRGAQEHPWEIR